MSYRVDDAADRGLTQVTVVLIAVILVTTVGLAIGIYVFTFDDATYADQAPNATFAFEHDEETGTLTITHAGDEGVPADRLQVTGIAAEDDRWSDVDPESGVVEAGDSIAVEPTGDRVAVVWLTSTGEQAAPLDEWEGGDG